MNENNESNNTGKACFWLGVAIIAGLTMLQFRSDAQVNEVIIPAADEREARFEAEQFLLEMELVGELRGRREYLDDPVAYIATLDEWFAENRARLLEQAALGTELDAAEPPPEIVSPIAHALEVAPETEVSMLVAELRRLASDESQTTASRISTRETVLARLAMIESERGSEARVLEFAPGSDPEEPPAWLEEISRLRRASDLTALEKVRFIEHILLDHETAELETHNPEQ